MSETFEEEAVLEHDEAESEALVEHVVRDVSRVGLGIPADEVGKRFVGLVDAVQEFAEIVSFLELGVSLFLKQYELGREKLT